MLLAVHRKPDQLEYVNRKCWVFIPSVLALSVVRKDLFDLSRSPAPQTRRPPLGPGPRPSRPVPPESESGIMLRVVTPTKA